MSFAGYQLCLEAMRGGHFCHLPKKHRGQAHTCNCQGMPVPQSGETDKVTVAEALELAIK